MRACKFVLSLLAVACLSIGALSPAAAQKKAEAKKSAPAQAAATAELIDVNTASVEQLKAIPGIGDAYSERIVKNRPYRAKNEIVSKAGVPDGVYQKIKDRIIARQAAKARK